MLKRTFILIGLVLSFCSLPAQELIQITTRNTALVFRVANQSLRQVYYGPRLADTDVLQKQGNNFPAYSTYGMGEQNEVALHAVHADGNTSTLLNFENVKQESPEPGITLTTISLKDPLYPFQVKLFYKAYEESDLIEQWTIYQHTEKKPVTLYQFASAQLSSKSSSYRLTHFAGDWAGECNMSEVELTEGIKVIDSKLGTRATFFAHPMCLLSLNGRMTEDNGEVIGMALAWPANFKLEFEKNNNQELRVLAGMNPYASHYKLKKGDVFQTPSFLYTYSTKGNGQVSRNFHRWARKYGLRHGENSRYTLMNNWEATYFNFNEPKLKSIIEDAAGMGFELFLLDDGWFGQKHPRNNDDAGLGDWVVNKEKLPNGLGWLVKQCTDNDIKFGIWVEPEMVNPQSELFEKHPDWVIQQPEREHILFRRQLVLDLSNPEVQEFVYKSVHDILKDNPQIAFVKWDCNRAVTNPGSTYLPADEQSHIWIEYGRGLLNVFKKVRDSHPDVHFMLCSGGGGRLDYGSLRYFEEYWPSDNTDALQRILIQWGNSQFFPSIAMCCHVSASPNHQTGRTTPLKFRFDVAMQGALGMDLQPSTMNEKEVIFAKEAIKTYESIRNIVFTGDLYRILSPYEGNRTSMMYVLPDKSRAVFYAYQLKSHIGEVSAPMRFKGLIPDKKYNVKELNIYPGSRAATGSANGQSFSGDFLMNQGLPIGLSGDYSSAVIELEQQ